MKKGVCQEAERTTDIDAWLAASKNGAHILHFPVVLQQNNFITIKKTVISRLMVTKFQEKKLKSQQIYSYSLLESVYNTLWWKKYNMCLTL